MKHKCTSLINRIIKAHKIYRYTKTKPAIYYINKNIIKVCKCDIKFAEISLNFNNVQHRHIKIQKEKNQEFIKNKNNCCKCSTLFYIITKTSMSNSNRYIIIKFTS